jgi:hypothetical protein
LKTWIVCRLTKMMSIGGRPGRAGATGPATALRFEATVHNARELRCRRDLAHFDQMIAALAGMTDRFATALDCADVSFLPDGILDQLPQPATIGATRTGGIDLNKPRLTTAAA